MGVSGLFGCLTRDGVLSHSDQLLIQRDSSTAGPVLPKALISLGYFTAEGLREYIVERTKISAVSKPQVNPSTFRILPLSIAEALEIVPISVSRQHFEYAVADPLDRGVLDSLHFLVDKMIRPRVCSLAEIYQALHSHNAKFSPRCPMILHYLKLDLPFASWRREEAPKVIAEPDRPANDVMQDIVEKVDIQATPPEEEVSIRLDHSTPAADPATIARHISSLNQSLFQVRFTVGDAAWENVETTLRSCGINQGALIVLDSNASYVRSWLNPQLQTLLEPLPASRYSVAAEPGRIAAITEPSLQIGAGQPTVGALFEIEGHQFFFLGQWDHACLGHEKLVSSASRLILEGIVALTRESEALTT